MVDFNNEATVATPSWDVLKILALEKREHLFAALEYYYKKKNIERQTGDELGIIKARLQTLYLELQGMLQKDDDFRTLDKEGKPHQKGLDFQKQMLSDKEEDIVDACQKLNLFMYKVNLTKVDTKRQYDRTRVESENDEKGL